MTYSFNISEIGLRLIKAYEGFYPEPVRLSSGVHLIGFGHRLSADDNMKSVDEKDAEKLLIEDLKPVVSLLNRAVHASMTQSQFDALCSLAYTIGPNAILSSSILYNLNQGKIIEAANGFDDWRYGTISGKTYMVDALVRRRTAEKALFLRPTVKTPSASRYGLTPQRQGETGVKAPAEWQSVSSKSSSRAAASAQSETRIYDDASDSIRPLSQIVTDDNDSTGLVVETVDMLNLVDNDAPAASNDRDTSDDDVLVLDNRAENSLIAETAAEISQRLDALIGGDNAQGAASDYDTDYDDSWPDSMVSRAQVTVDQQTQDGNVINISARLSEINEQEPDVIIDEIEMDDALRNVRNSGTNNGLYQYTKPEKIAESQMAGLWAYVTMTVIGFTMLLGGIFVNMKGSTEVFGKFGPFITVSAVTLGVMLFLIGAYHLLKLLFRAS